MCKIVKLDLLATVCMVIVRNCVLLHSIVMWVGPVRYFWLDEPVMWAAASVVPCGIAGENREFHLSIYSSPAAQALGNSER